MPAARCKNRKKDLKEKSKTGTVAHGFVIINNEKYTYREVDWDNPTEKMANLAANKHGGEWDDDKLSELLQELSEMPIFDADITGFDSAEIDEILSQITKEGQIDDDEVPEVPAEPITKTGDIYILGNHRLLCGDCTVIAQLELLMGGGTVNMVFTDPPYGMDLDTDFASMQGIGKGKKYKSVIGDNNPFDPTFVFNNFKCKEIFLWGADYYTERIPARLKGSWFVWDKQGGGNGCNDAYDKMFGSNFELCWSKQRHKRALVRVLWKGFFGLGKDDTKIRIHPTQKPTELVTWFLDKFSQHGDFILDPFLGSGSTLIACEKTGRICYGMEIDPHYCDVIVTRYCKYTGNNKITKNGEMIEWPL